MFKIAAFQGSSYQKDREKSLEKIRAILSFADAHDVDVLCMPEGYLQGYFETKEEALQYSINLESTEFSALCSQLASYKTTLLLGLNEQEGDLLYDTVIVLEQGRLLGRYCKAYVYHNYFTPGREFPVF